MKYLFRFFQWCHSMFHHYHIPMYVRIIRKFSVFNLLIMRLNDDHKVHIYAVASTMESKSILLFSSSFFDVCSLKHNAIIMLTMSTWPERSVLAAKTSIYQSNIHTTLSTNLTLSLISKGMWSQSIRRTMVLGTEANVCVYIIINFWCVRNPQYFYQIFFYLVWTFLFTGLCLSFFLTFHFFSYHLNHVEVQNI